MPHGLIRRENTCSLSLMGTKWRDDSLGCGKYYPCCFWAVAPMDWSPVCFLHLCKMEVNISIKCYAHLCNNFWFKLWHIVYKDTGSTHPRCENTAPSCFYPASIRGIPYYIWRSQVQPIPDEKAEFKKMLQRMWDSGPGHSSILGKGRRLPLEDVVSASGAL